MTKSQKEALRNYKYAVNKRDEFMDKFKRVSDDKKQAVFDAQIRYGRILHTSELLLEEYKRLQWADKAFDDENGERDIEAHANCIDLAESSIKSLWSRLDWVKAL